jgi:hypothetical protein
MKAQKKSTKIDRTIESENHPIYGYIKKIHIGKIKSGVGANYQKVN